jgi:hypothetical protein
LSCRTAALDAQFNKRAAARGLLDVVGEHIDAHRIHVHVIEQLEDASPGLLAMSALMGRTVPEVFAAGLGQ